MGWQAWKLDVPTWGWIAWMAFFVAWETYTIVMRPGEELTEHLRPVFAYQPLTWFLAVSLWVWTGVHLLAPSLEAAIMRWVD